MKVDYLQYTNTKQLAHQLIMIRPANFGFNTETASNNVFQSDEGEQSPEDIKRKAIAEFDELVKKLRERNVNVLVIDDTDEPVKTDAVFPNNWFSLHENGVVVTYPMFSPNRRLERREDILERFKEEFKINKHYSFEFYEDDDMFLEGTGSMIFDRVNKVVYSSLSGRTEPRLLEKFSVLMSYRKIVFHGLDSKDQPIYHTNVMMTLGLDFAVICLSCIRNEEEKKATIKMLEDTGKDIIEITEEQMNSFAGNLLQVKNEDGDSILVMSEQAYNALSKAQIDKLSAKTSILYADISTIEQYGGGSARCMIAENFLTPRVVAPEIA